MSEKEWEPSNAQFATKQPHERVTRKNQMSDPRRHPTDDDRTVGTNLIHLRRECLLFYVMSKPTAQTSPLTIKTGFQPKPTSSDDEFTPRQSITNTTAREQREQRDSKMHCFVLCLTWDTEAFMCVLSTAIRSDLLIFLSYTDTQKNLENLPTKWTPQLDHPNSIRKFFPKIS